MNVLRLLNSSIGKKYLIGATGLLLCGFLVVHLAGNVLMYVGPAAYNGYAHTLHSQEWFVKTAESGLLALFLVHLGLAIRVTLGNTRARGVGYAEKQTKQSSTGFGNASAWMLISGTVVLVFVVWHLIDFTFEARDAIKPVAGLDYEAIHEQNEESAFADQGYFDKSVLLLQDPISIGVYSFGCLFLMFHLAHGFASAFQSLGISHPKWNGLIKWAGLTFAFVMGFGFLSFVAWAQFMPTPGTGDSEPAAAAEE